MPLLTSPIDGSPMRQIQRFGIELDICPTSGGVWLDKGELEKLMALIKQAAEEEAFEQSRAMPAAAAGYDRRPKDDYRRHEDDYRPKYRDRDDDEYYRRHGKYKKKGALSQVMEIFDF